MGHNSKIGYPYLPAREPWRGRDVLQRAWRATLAGPADDPGGDTGRRTQTNCGTRKSAWWATLDGERPWQAQRSSTRKTSLAGDPAGWRTKLVGTAEDRIYNDSLTHQKSLVGDPGGDGGRPADSGRRTPDDSQKQLDGGQPWRGRRTTTLAGTDTTDCRPRCGDPGGDGTLAGTSPLCLAGDAGRDGKNLKSLADDCAGLADDPGGARSTLPLAKRA